MNAVVFIEFWVERKPQLVLIAHRNRHTLYPTQHLDFIIEQFRYRRGANK